MYDRDYAIFSVRSAAILTTSYVAGTVLGPTNASTASYNQLIIYWDFTLGSLTSGELKVEFSHDGTNYYQETFSSVSTGTSTDTLGEHTTAATGKRRIAIPIKDNYIKISVKGTGTVTSSSCKVDAILGTV